MALGGSGRQGDDDHTALEEAGIVFAKAKPKLAGYTNITIIPPPTVQTVIESDSQNSGVRSLPEST